MTREFEPDPEVLADLELREQTIADRTRTRGPVGARGRDWKPPEFVGQWRCRSCSQRFVRVTADDMEHAAMMNDALRRRGEQPVDVDKIVFCDDCRDRLRGRQADRNAEKGERLRVEIIKLKQTDEPWTEAALIRNLRDLGHPDVDGLVNSLKDKAKARSEKARGKAKL